MIDLCTTCGYWVATIDDQCEACFDDSQRSGRAVQETEPIVHRTAVCGSADRDGRLMHTAHCPCGWHGLTTRSVSTAEADAADHLRAVQETERPPGIYPHARDCHARAGEVDATGWCLGCGRYVRAVQETTPAEPPKPSGMVKVGGYVACLECEFMWRNPRPDPPCIYCNNTGQLLPEYSVDGAFIRSEWSTPAEPQPFGATGVGSVHTMVDPYAAGRAASPREEQKPDA